MEIVLVNVKDLLADTTDLVTPASGQMFGDMPLPRAAKERPSAEELVASDKS